VIMIAIRSWRDVTIIDHSNDPTSTALPVTMCIEFHLLFCVFVNTARHTIKILSPADSTNIVAVNVIILIVRHHTQ